MPQYMHGITLRVMGYKRLLRVTTGNFRHITMDWVITGYTGLLLTLRGNNRIHRVTEGSGTLCITYTTGYSGLHLNYNRL